MGSQREHLRGEFKQLAEYIGEIRFGQDNSLDNWQPDSIGESIILELSKELPREHNHPTIRTTMLSSVMVPWCRQSGQVKRADVVRAHEFESRVV